MRRPALLALGAAGLALALAVAGRPLAPKTVPTAGPASASTAPPPARLADTGLWTDATTGALAPGVWPFEPQYPLWTDGASKRRWIRLPDGAAVDASDPDRWRLPVGTRIWKEFSFERPVETR